LRGFAQGLALIVGALGSYFLFEFKITPLFIGGVVLVIVATFLYGASAKTPLELCEYLGLTCAVCMGSRSAESVSPASAEAAISLITADDADEADEAGEPKSPVDGALATKA